MSLCEAEAAASEIEDASPEAEEVDATVRSERDASCAWRERTVEDAVNEKKKQRHDLSGRGTNGCERDGSVGKPRE